MPVSFVAASLGLAAFIAAMMFVPRPAEIYPARASFSTFPMELGGWHGTRESMEAIYSDTLLLDDYLLANYTDSSERSANLYISWYDSQRKGEAVHSPRSCLPGGGWQMRDFGQRDLPAAPGGRPLRVNRTVIELGNDRQLVYYWFQQRGRDVTNEFAVKWYLFWDALTRHRTDGAMVRLIAPLPAGAGEASADARLTDLAAQVARALPRFAPD
jgi:EpsI family protein